MYPALAVLQALQLPNKEADNEAPDVLWVGGEGGMEAALVQRAGVPFAAIPAAGLHGVGLRALPGNLLRLARGFLAARKLLARFRPDVLFFTGGYVAVPLALAARFPLRGLARPRSLVYIPDIEPGLALKALLRFSDQAALTGEASRAYLPQGLPAVVSGYPVRHDLLQNPSALDLALEAGLPTLLVFGGSKGARSINRALLGALPQLLPEMQIIHISGELDWPEVQSRLSANPLPTELAQRYHPYPYLHEQMGAALAAADLVLSRAGASSLGEFPLFGLPAVLAPYPYAWRYQRVNAEHLVQAGAALLVTDAELPEKIAPLLRDLMFNSARRAAMRQAMQSLARPQAAQTIAGLLRQLAARGGNRG